MDKYSTIFMFAILLSVQACVADDTLKIGAGLVSFHVAEQSQANQYTMVARGSNKNTQAEVIEAFNIKAKALCKKDSYLLDYVVESYESNTLASIGSRAHQAYQATGTVVCKTTEKGI